MLPRQALANSRNIPAVKVTQDLGLDAVYDLLGELDLHSYTTDPGHYGVGLALGGMPVRLLDLVTAYGTLANDGQLRPLRWFEDSPSSPGRAVFRPSTARLVRTWLSDPTARSPTFPRAGFAEHGFPVAMKTGTSPDHRDSWSIAITERYIVGVWVGHPDWRPMRGLSGYRGAGSIVSSLLQTLHDDQRHGLDGQPFAEPEGWTTASICAMTGSLATDRCDTPRVELFAPGTSPLHDCTAHVREGARVVLDLPPHYSPWLAAHHLPTAHPPLDPDTPVSIDILSPTPNISIMADPDIPSQHSTLRLAASVDPPVEQVVWWVDEQPFATVSYPYVARWPVQPGSHTFSVRVARGPERSRTVRIDAR
jgi:penicillin-binding protein 1C